MVVQEVIRMVLESIYETQRFAQARSAHLCLHTHPFGGSFRPNRFFCLEGDKKHLEWGVVASEVRYKTIFRSNLYTTIHIISQG